MEQQVTPIPSGASCLNSVGNGLGQYSAICQCCGRKSRPATPLRPGEPDLFTMARGWSTAPFPADFIHSDGSRGSTFTCPDCNKRLRSGESLVLRAYLREVGGKPSRLARDNQGVTDDFGTLVEV